MEQLPLRLKEELHRFLPPSPEDFEKFKQKWGIKVDGDDLILGDDATEFLNVSDTIYNEYRYKRGLNKSCWKEFKAFWGLPEPDTLLMFEEMSKLSTDMLWEWRLKYHEFSQMPSKKRKLTSLPELWSEFKDFWELDIANYNEDKYLGMIRDLDEEQRGMTRFESNAWDERVSDCFSHHSTYEELSILDKYRFWREFASEL